MMEPRQVHERIHSNAKPLQCPHCPAAFKAHGSLRWHLGHTHADLYPTSAHLSTRGCTVPEADDDGTGLGVSSKRAAAQRRAGAALESLCIPLPTSRSVPVAQQAVLPKVSLGGPLRRARN